MQPTATQARRQQLKEAEEIRVNEEGIVALRRRKSNAKFRARKKAELKKLQEDLKQKHEIDKQRNQQHQDEEKDISNEKRMNLEDVEHYSAIRSVSYSQPSKDHSMSKFFITAKFNAGLALTVRLSVRNNLNWR